MIHAHKWSAANELKPCLKAVISQWRENNPWFSCNIFCSDAKMLYLCSWIAKRYIMFGWIKRLNFGTIIFAVALSAACTGNHGDKTQTAESWPENKRDGMKSVSAITMFANHSVSISFSSWWKYSASLITCSHFARRSPRSILLNIGVSISKSAANCRCITPLLISELSNLISK